MPWLTVLIFLPLVGIPVLALWRGASDVQARAVALVVSLATFLVALGMLGAFDPSVAGYQLVEHVGLAALGGSVLPRGRRRVQRLAGRAHRVHDAGGDRLVVGREPSGAAVHGAHAAARDRDRRLVPRARPAAVLRVLRGAPGPDVPRDRHVGFGPARVREPQVLPVHDGGVGVPVARDRLPLVPDVPAARPRELRHPSDGTALARHHDAALAVPRLLHRVRGQGADLPAAHVAAGRAHRGADERLDRPGGAAAEGRTVRPAPVQPRPVPRGVAVLRARRSASSRSSASSTAPSSR